ncbi:MAG TPA: DUF1622 domain-containing protein [Chitinispirillaceae bacterium]|nr:DUF1622 domain-containing protein [Chitinispirillaceae bacterium]
MKLYQMLIKELIQIAGLIIDIVGVIIIAGGTLYLIIKALVLEVFSRKEKEFLRFQEYRKNLGKIILTGLEFLVAGDLIRTVAVEPTFESVGVLAGIVAIRTFMSFSLEIEMTGRWPWAKKESNDNRS